MTDVKPGIDKEQARQAFAKAADTYDDVAVLQREIGSRMLERLQLVLLQPGVVLDMGSGTGGDIDQLIRHYKKSRVVALDFALPMLQKARQRGSWLHRPGCICGDLEKLPLAENSVDLVYSNLALQWSNDLPAVFSECMRVLKPGGLLMFSTFGPDTLYELRTAWAEIDKASHVSPFVDMHDIGDMLMQTRFADPVMDVETLTMTYQTLDRLMRDIKGLGAQNATLNRPRGLTGKLRMAALRQAYEQFRQDGVLPASYEVVYGHAWAPDQLTVDGETRVSLDMLRGSRA